MKFFLPRMGRFQNKESIILRDYLALERTRLANERTLLSYLRSSLYLLVGGIAILQLQGFETIKFLGYVSLGLAVLCVVVGLVRFWRLNRKLMNYYTEMRAQQEAQQANPSI